MRLSSKTDFLGEQKYICYSFDIIQFSTRLKYIQKEHVTPYPRKMCTKVLVGVMDPGQLAFYNDAQMVSQFHSVLQCQESDMIINKDKKNYSWVGPA